MQTVWSRSLQARNTCSCPSCLSPRAILSRRTTTAPRRRRLPFGQAVTVLYSSVLATAAVLDSQWKDKKRRDLDLAIVHVKDELRRVEEDQQRRLRALGLGAVPEDLIPRIARDGPSAQLPHASEHAGDGSQSYGQMDVFEELKAHTIPDGGTTGHTKRSRNPPRLRHSAVPTEDKYPSRMKWGDWGACQTVNEERNRNLKKTNASLKDVRPTVSRSGLGTVSMKQNFEKLRMDQLFTYFIHDSRPDCGICRSVEDMWKSREGLVHLPKRLILIRETAVAILAYQLLHHCMEDSAARSESDLAGDIQQKSLAQEKEQLESKIEGLKRRIAYLNDPDTDDDALLKVEPLRFPSYREDNTATFNSAMRLLLSHDLPLEELLKKVCYNLLISKSPPDVHTLNVLILRLCHAGHVRPAWSVIHALFDCQIAPNEVTIAAILTFYTVTDDLSGFVAFVGHFATPGPVDLVAHPRKVPDYAKRPESFKATNHSILISRLDYFSLATRSELSAMGRQRSQEIQEALIIGWLKFKSIKEAHLEYERMGMLGFWKASPELIEAVDWLCENIGTASCNGAISGAALKLKLETEALLLKWNAEMQCLRAEMHALESSAATETPESDVALHETEKGDPGTESMENDRAQEIQPKVHHVWERSRPFQRWINISTNPDVPIYLEYRRSSMAIQESEFFALMTAFRRSRWLTEHQLLDLAPEASAETIHMTRQNQTRKIYEETVPYKPLLRPSFLEAQRQYERATVVPMDTCNPRISKVIRGYS